MSATTIRLLLTERARALLYAELNRAHDTLMLDLAEVTERRAIGAIALISETLSAVADAREQLSAPALQRTA